MNSGTMQDEARIPLGMDSDAQIKADMRAKRAAYEKSAQVPYGEALTPQAGQSTTGCLSASPEQLQRTRESTLRQLQDNMVYHANQITHLQHRTADHAEMVTKLNLAISILTLHPSAGTFIELMNLGVL